MLGSFPHAILVTHSLANLKPCDFIISHTLIWNFADHSSHYFSKAEAVNSFNIDESFLCLHFYPFYKVQKTCGLGHLTSKLRIRNVTFVKNVTSSQSKMVHSTLQTPWPWSPACQCLKRLLYWLHAIAPLVTEAIPASTKVARRLILATIGHASMVTCTNSLVSIHNILACFIMYLVTLVLVDDATATVSVDWILSTMEWSHLLL